MVAETLNKSLDLIFGVEKGYTNTPGDPGGPTNYGITIKTLSAVRGRSVTVDDVKNLTKDEAEQILRKEYATPIQYDSLPPGVDYCVLDCCVNSGPERAAEILQGCVGVKTDGIIGAKTLDAVRTTNPQRLIVDYCAKRVEFMQSLTTWGQFGRGWTIRVTGEDPKGEWAPVPGVVGNALAMVGNYSVDNRVLMSDTVVGDSQSKATGAKKLTSSNQGVTAVVTTVGAVGAAATTAASQLAPVSSVQVIQHIIIGLTVLAAGAGLVVAIVNARNN